MRIKWAHIFRNAFSIRTGWQNDVESRFGIMENNFVAKSIAIKHVRMCAVINDEIK